MATTTKPVYVTVTALAVTALHSLATSASLIAGWQSDVFVCSTDLNVDEQISGEIIVAAAGLSVGLIQVYAWGQLNDSPTYPEVGTAGTRIGGSEAALTFATADARNAASVLIASVVTPTTASLKHPIKPVGIAQFFGGVLPKRYGIFVTHSTGANLAAASSFMTRTQLQYTQV